MTTPLIKIICRIIIFTIVSRLSDPVENERINIVFIRSNIP
jgi:hypothetical protein